MQLSTVELDAMRMVLLGGVIACLLISAFYLMQKHYRLRIAELIEAIPVPLVLVREADGYVTATNIRWQRLTGWSHAETIGRRFAELGIWHDHSDSASGAEALTRLETSLGYEAEVKRKDGTVFRGAFDASRTRLGRQQLAVVSLRDVSELRHQEIELRATKERLAGLFLSVPDYIAISTANDGRMIEVNSGFEDLTGWSRHEVIGRTSIEIGILTADQRAEGYAVLQRSGGVVRNFPADLKRKDGSIRHTLMSLTVFPVNGVAQMIAIGRDITEMKEQEMALRATEERLACMFRAIPDLVTVSRLADGRLVGVNKGFEEMTGWTSDEVIGRTSLELGYISAEAREQGLVALKRHGAALKDFAVDVRAKNGTVRHTLTSGAVFAAGGHDYLIAVSRDVTALRRKEEELRLSDAARQAAEAEALRAQAETIRAQDETLRAQSEKMASLTQLVSNVAHEINTPIAALKSSSDNVAAALGEVLAELPKLFRMLDEKHERLFVELIRHSQSQTASLSTRDERAIRKKVTRQLEEAGIMGADNKARILVGLGAHSTPLDYLPLLRHPECELILGTANSFAAIVVGTETINTAVGRVGKIVSTLKAFAQAEHGGELFDGDLKDGIESVLAAYANQLKQGTEVVRQYENVPNLRCHHDALRQVWTHLIHNALQAMAYQGRLTVALRREVDDAVVSITDTGSGIPDHVLPRIFEPFFSTRPQGEGSGLGLSVLKKIVEKHHGRIEVETKLGVGSTFSVYLPLNRPA